MRPNSEFIPTSLFCCEFWFYPHNIISHYSDVIMNAIAPQITSFSTVNSSVCSGAHQRKHQSSTLLAFVRGNHPWPVDSPPKGSVTRKLFPFDEVIMLKPKSAKLLLHWSWTCRKEKYCYTVKVRKIWWRHEAKGPNKPHIWGVYLRTRPGGRFKNTFELLNIRALKFSVVNKIHIFQCMGKITKYLTHTLKDMIFIQHWNLKSS